jgi:hypothetical protein
MAKYGESPITRAEWSTQSLAKGLAVGMRFPSTQVVRYCDAKAMQLVKALPADGRWRIVIFAGDLRLEAPAGRLKMVSLVLRYDFLTDGCSLQVTCRLQKVQSANIPQPAPISTASSNQF